MNFDGFIDYGPDEIEDNNTEFTDQLANHALVFIFRPYRSSWIKPIAVLATKGAAPGYVILRLLAKAIVVLEAAFARVTSVTCDGAQTNNRVWADCKICGKRVKDGKISCSMEHPRAMRKRIWFLQDVPYLFKCVRNHIFSRRRLVKPRRKIPVKEKGTVSTKDPAPTSSLEPPSSLLPALASSVPAPTSS